MALQLGFGYSASENTDSTLTPCHSLTAHPHRRVSAHRELQLRDTAQHHKGIVFRSLAWDKHKTQNLKSIFCISKVEKKHTHTHARKHKRCVEFKSRRAAYMPYVERGHSRGHAKSRTGDISPPTDKAVHNQSMRWGSDSFWKLRVTAQAVSQVCWVDDFGRQYSN